MATAQSARQLADIAEESERFVQNRQIRGHVSRPLPGYPDEAPVGTFHAFSGDEGGEKIDFIFAQPAPVAEVLMAQIIREHRDGLYPSDHFPVTARLRLQP
ncbi:hypothetical protein WMF27_42015 [Sorangium sp. So ce281]|uniref:hypothetical protein n=1 Tax=unclassified Sorangium TaxID=2621164 RepID=UPI003F6472BD